MDVHVTDVTQALSAVNLAGPRAREIIAGLTDLDCSNEALSSTWTPSARRSPASRA